MLKRIAFISLISLFPIGTVFAQSSFEERCNAPGVILCTGFDSVNEIGPYVLPANDGVTVPTLDTSVKASGNGSLLFTIRPFTGPNNAGSLRRNMGQAFGSGSTFYVQYRQRFSPEMVTTNFGGDGWKQSIFHYHKKTCGSVEITMQNGIHRNFPQPYSQCGSDPFRLYYGSSGGDYYHQWTQNAPNQLPGDVLCDYTEQLDGNDEPGDCFYYKANQWMTFYFQVQLGNWGSPNSTVNIWMAEEGQPLKMTQNLTDHTFYQNGGFPNSAYDMVTLTTYITNKPSNKNHPTARTWYDELIVSTQPIAAPTGSPPPPGEQLPLAPVGLLVDPN